MPVKQKGDWEDYFNKVNRTLNNFEQRLEKLENRVEVLSKKSVTISKEAQTEIAYESPPKRRLGWGLIWTAILILILDFMGFDIIDDIFDIMPFGSSLVLLVLLIVGVVLILITPKQGVLAYKKTKRQLDLGEETLEIPVKETVSKVKKATARAEAAKKISKSDFEADIGKKWLARIGIISIVLGVAFFVIYAIQNKWIGPTGQIAIGVIAGIVLVIVGELFHKKEYHAYGLTLVGGGFAIIYFAMFAAYRFYNLLPLVADVASLSAVIIGVIIFSIRYNSKIIAAEAFFLGYIVPLLTNSVNTFFLIYAIALTAGLTILACIKNWRVIGAVGIAAMYITHIFWLDYYTTANESMLHILFLFIYFIMFGVMALKLKESAKVEIDSWIDLRSIIAVIFIVTYIFLFQLDFENPYIVFAPLILLLIILSFLVMKFKWDYFIVGGIIMTYFVHWKWLQDNFNESSVFINFIALSIYFILFNIVIFMLYENKNKISNVIGILVNSGLYYSLNAWPSFYFPTGWRGLFTAAVSVFYLIFAYLSYNKKINHYFNTYIVLCFGYLTLTIPLQFNQEWVTISWTVLTLILVLLSFRLKEDVIRVSSSIVGAITLGRLLFYDSWKLTEPIYLGVFSITTRLFVFAIAILIFYIITYLYYKNKELFENYKSYIVYVNAAYAIAATLLTTVIIWLEIWDTELALNAKKLWTSLAFILQAIIILGFGFSAKNKLFRIMGLVLFGLSILKVFLYDLSNLETGYRIISFIVLGVIALLGAFLYNKYKEHI